MASDALRLQKGQRLVLLWWPGTSVSGSPAPARLSFCTFLCFSPTLLEVRYAIHPDDECPAPVDSATARHPSAAAVTAAAWQWRPASTQCHGGILLTEDCKLVGFHGHSPSECCSPDPWEQYCRHPTPRVGSASELCDEWPSDDKPGSAWLWCSAVSVVAVVAEISAKGPARQ